MASAENNQPENDILAVKTSESLIADISSNPISPRMDEFARIYEPLLRRFVRMSKSNFDTIPEPDQDDIVQEAFVSVMKAMSHFKYDRKRGSLRAYLASVVRNHVVAYQRSNNIIRPLNPDSPEIIEKIEAGQKHNPENETARRELMLKIWSATLTNVFGKNSFSPNTKAIFNRYVLEGIPAEKVAEEFKVKSNTIYQIKNRIICAVRRELRNARKRISDEHDLELLLAELQR